MRNNLIVKAGFKPATTLLTAAIAFAIAFTLSCSSGGDDDGGSGGGSGGGSSGGGVNGGSLSYEGKTYKTVKIGNQTWMAENLNYDVSGSVCYDNDPSNCVTYGRLYDWATAMALPSSCNSSECASQVGAKHRGICPSGWHIPSDAEWTTLTDYVGGESTAGTKLKAKSGWNEGGNGTDNYGFAALPGGYGNSKGIFFSVGNYGYWWSASEGNADDAYYRYMDYLNESVSRYGSYKYNRLFSVRCLQD